MTSTYHAIAAVAGHSDDYREAQLPKRVLSQSPKRGSFGSRSLDVQESPRNAGNTLAEADGTEREIMARLGHKSPQMAAHYTKRASQKKLARSAVEKIERAKIARG